MAPTKRVLFRADASPVIGGGHVMRCLTLADALAEKGWECHFASLPGAQEIVPKNAFETHRLAVLPATKGSDPDALPAGPWDLLVIDHYGLDEKYEQQARQSAKEIFVIDDLADRNHECDFLLDQNLGRRRADYRSHVPAGAMILAGPDYALLRPDFARARNRRLAMLDRPVTKVFVFVGLGDPDGVVLTALDGVEASGIDLSMEIVIGAAAPQRATVERRMAAFGSRARLHSSVGEIAGLMAGCDIAIGAGGGTSWERCALGIPTVLIAVADNQIPGSYALAKAGAADFVGPFDKLAASDIAASLIRLGTDTDYRRNMAEAAARICDGLGARRVAQVIAPPAARDGAPIALRPATEDDGEIMLAWQCHPDMRRYFRNPEPPTRDEHFRWLSSKLSDPKCLFNIVEHDHRPVGVVRLDHTSGDSWEVSILTAPGHERQGLARAALDLTSDLVPERRLLAEVKPGNVAACDLFRSAGYSETGPGQFERTPLVAAA